MEECDEIRRWSEAHSRLVTIYRTEPITLAEHLIRARCSHLSLLGAGMEEFALFVLLCFTVLSHICCFLHICLSLHVSFSLCLCIKLLLFFYIYIFCCIYLISQISLAKSSGGVLTTYCPTRGSWSETGCVMASFRNSSKQTSHNILGCWPCISHIDYSMDFTGESSGPNAVLKAFPASKEKRLGMKRHYLKILKSGTKWQIMFMYI